MWAGDPCAIALANVARDAEVVVADLNEAVMRTLEKYNVHASVRRQIEHLGEVAQKKAEKL